MHLHVGLCTCILSSVMGRRNQGIRKPGIKAGDHVGQGGAVLDQRKKDKHGHAFVKVQWFHSRKCPDCHGKPKWHRTDYLRSGRVVSCGNVKRKNYKSWVKDSWGVDARTGQPIPKSAKKVSAA
jgi:hypothetical protein